MKVDFTNFLKRATTEDPYFQFLKIEIVDLQPGNVKMKLFIDKDFHTNRMGISHGAPLAAMSDACMGWSCRTLGYHVVTINIDISFVRPIPEETWVYGEGKILHEGSNTLVGEARFHDEGGHLSLVGKGTYWIRHRIDLATDV